MNGFVTFWNLFLVCMVYLGASSLNLRGAEAMTYIYVLTEDAKLGPFGKVEGLEVSKPYMFHLQTDQHFVDVDEHTGIMKLTRRLTSLRRDRNGIRKLLIEMTAEMLHSYSNNDEYHRRGFKIQVKLIIFPLRFGDTFLQKYGKRLRILVQRSKVFSKSKTTTSYSLHRFLRMMPRNVDSKASNEAYSSIKFKRGIELATNDIIRKYVPKTNPKRHFQLWYLNSLFSKRVLEWLASKAGCPEEEVVIKCPTKAKYRTINGTCNNVENPLFGSAPRAFNRLFPAHYYDAEGLDNPIGYPDQPLAPKVPSPFEVAREFISSEDKPSKNSRSHSHCVMQWGQWLDHDLSLTPESESSDSCQEVRCRGNRDDFQTPCFPILPNKKSKCIHFARSASKCPIKKGHITVREQININTAYIDGSQVYGSTDELAKALRDYSNDGGLLRTAYNKKGDFLPSDSSELMAPNNLCHDLGGCFIAGDTRSSEQQVLAAMHTLFVREHNRMARLIGKINPHWNGERIYHETRKIVWAVLQKITFHDYLPIIIGDTMPKYEGYDPTANPDILNSFATAAYRFGHSTIRPMFDLLNENFDPVEDPMPLRFLFFNNTYMRKNGIDHLLLGMLGNASEPVDHKIASALLNNLFERPNSPGLNLAALNIQRGREHGLLGYNAYRQLCGFKDAKSFSDTRKEIRSTRNRRILAKLYNDNPDLADLWVAGLAEAPARGGAVGPTFACIIRKQFLRIRAGDSFYYKRPGIFTKKQVEEIEKTTLSRIFCDNLKTIVSIQRNAFHSGSKRYRRMECGRIPGINLRAWKEERESCDPNPCLHGGLCQNGSPFSCICLNGYYGEICEEKIEYCNPNPCLHGGICKDGSPYSCICLDGYYGENCEEKLETCNPNPCLHGGICKDGSPYSCICLDGYYGEKCEERESCNPNPCLHGGICKNGSPFSCTCLNGYYGERCEEREYCKPNPCLHGGICKNVKKERSPFSCKCLNGLSGKRCEKLSFISICRRNTCLNGGSCEAIYNKKSRRTEIRCHCTQGWSGSRCSLKRESCNPNPCLHGGICQDGSPYSCTCLDGYYGERCEEKLESCNPNPCLHGGICQDGSPYSCTCLDGYYGERCEEKLESCNPNPCLHGGICQDGSPYSCTCLDGYYGERCEEERESCNPNPCLHGGICKNGSPYYCTCLDGYYGERCEEERESCNPNPCLHGGICKNGSPYYCTCLDGYYGERCEEERESCNPNPCLHGGICQNGNPFSCICVNGFSGERCEAYLKYMFVLTEDAKPGPFGRIETQKDSSQTIFRMQRYQPFVEIGRRTGILRLRKQLIHLPQDKNGIRRLSLKITCKTRSQLKDKKDKPGRTIKVELMIFPLYLGDAYLDNYSKKLRTGKVQQINTLTKNGATSGSLHRYIRLISPKADPKAFNYAFSSIKEERGIKEATDEITQHFMSNNESFRMLYIWYLNSLFSTSALKNLAKDAECNKYEVLLKCAKKAKFRTIDGSCNNVQNALFGSAPNPFNRLVPARYFDAEGLNDPIGFPSQPLAPYVPSPFEVVHDFIQEQHEPSTNNIYSHAVMQWGQWLDGDLDLTPESESSDICQEVLCDGSYDDFQPPCFSILPKPNFKCIRFARSAAKCQLEHGHIMVREQINVNTAFIDGSQVYGSTDILAKALREMEYDRGLLRVEPGTNGNFLPTDNYELVAPKKFCENVGGCFLSGDPRASEQQVLATMHTLFVREHNRLARTLRALNPQWNGERTYQEARKIVGAVLQKITYYDYLPIIIGNTMPEYRGYDPAVNPDVVNSFATAAFRFGHSIIRPTFDRLDSNFNPTGDPLPLKFLFFNNTFIRKFGIDPLLLGLLGNASETVDRKLASALLNDLFQRPKSPGLNLAALNIQRGRDHGVPGYNTFRRFCGFKNAKRFSDTRQEIPSRDNRRILSKLYKDNPEFADLWPAGLAEAPANGGLVGATFGCIIREQFRRIRDGDSFFYKREGVFTKRQAEEIERTTFSRILCDNLQKIVSVQRNAFLAGNNHHERVECSQIPGIDLTAWKVSVSKPICQWQTCLLGGTCKEVYSNFYGRKIIRCHCKSGWLISRRC